MGVSLAVEIDRASAPRGGDRSRASGCSGGATRRRFVRGVPAVKQCRCEPWELQPRPGRQLPPSRANK